MNELDRLRWHCRRGMLELDLLLERFNRDHLPRLNAEQAVRFAELLALPDHELLDLLMGQVSADPRHADLVGLMAMPPSQQPIHV